MKILQKASQLNGIFFILALWLLSRLVIVVAMQVVAPFVFSSPVHPEWTIAQIDRGTKTWALQPS